jgi:hypothetical protein
MFICVGRACVSKSTNSTNLIEIIMYGGDRHATARHFGDRAATS